MNIFNSLGSNYDFSYVINSFLSVLKRNNENKLKSLLTKRFGGEVVLFYKGREAIEASLLMSDLKKGDCVAINGYTCLVVEKAIERAGLRCEYLDIENDLNFSAKTLQEAITINKKIKAVIIQNTLGNLSDYKNIKKICDENNLVLIEDLAHSTISQNVDFSALSFSQDKIIDAVSGGALIIKNKKYLKNINKVNRFDISSLELIKDIFYPVLTFLIRSLYPIGIGKALHFVAKKMNVLSNPMSSEDSKLHNLPKWHINMAYYYFNQIDEVNSHRLEISQIYGGSEPNIRYPILVSDRNKFIEHIKKQGIYLPDIWYDYPVAPKKNKDVTSYEIGMCPKSERIAQQMINLPTHINIKKDDAIKILDLYKKWQNTK